MRNAEYWRERFTQLEAARHRFAAEEVTNITEVYKEAQHELEAQIDRWYRRFAKNNAITPAEARRWLTEKELAEFKWDVKDYIKHGEENALSEKWVKELENASARFHISRFEALKVNVSQSLGSLFSKRSTITHDTISGAFERGYYGAAYELQKGFGVGFDVAKINQAELESVLSKPWAADGYNFSERIWRDKSKLINEVHNELSQNIMLGGDPQKAIDAIAKKMNTSKYNAGRLVMTESAYFSSAAQKKCFEDLDVEQYEIVAALDSHTSEICRELDGKVFPMKDFEAGVTAPPFHVYCRSTTVPHFEENFGLTGERAARGADGKTYYVPADMTYREWEKTYVKAVDKPSESGIMEEGSGRKPITPITDNAIAHVPKVDIPGYTNEQCQYIQKQHKELLRYARDNNENKEVAFVFDKSLTRHMEFKGESDRLDFGSGFYGMGSELFVMHNHPRNGSFSDRDIRFFVTNNVKTLTIVKNDGIVETITKTEKFSVERMMILYARAFKRYVKTGTDKEIDKAILYILSKNGGLIEWINYSQS